MKPFLEYLTVTIISAFCGMVTGLVLLVFGGPDIWLGGYLIAYVGAPVSAIVVAIISARLTYGILDFELSETGERLGVGGMASILAVIGYFGAAGWVTAWWRGVIG